jgi:hypothetical protein
MSKDADLYPRLELGHLLNLAGKGHDLRDLHRRRRHRHTGVHADAEDCLEGHLPTEEGDGKKLEFAAVAAYAVSTQGFCSTDNETQALTR